MAKTRLKSVEPSEPKTKYTGVLTVLQRINQYEFEVEIRMMREGLNRNRWDYRNLDKHYETFVGRPILCAFLPNGKIGDGHNMRERVNPDTGERYYSFTDATSERIVGALSDNKEDFTIRTIDGEKWLIAKGRLWEFYAPELVQKIIRTGRMDVSVETMVENSYNEGDYEVFTDWVGIGVTILGDDVEPAIPNASIKALELLDGEFADAKMKAASFEKNGSKNNDSRTTQDQLTQKGEQKRMTVLNKKELSTLQSTYFKDYKVLAAQHDEEKGEKLVCLMREDGSTYLYIIGDAETTVQPERIKAMNVCAHIAVDANRSVDVDVYSMFESVNGDYATLSAELEREKERANGAEEKIKALETAERARRIKVAKEVAKATLETFNETSECKVDEKVLNKINEEIDRGDYADCENENGEWCGEEKVKDSVYAECGKAVNNYNSKKIAQNKTTVMWNKLRNRKDGDSIDAFLARKGIRKDD